MAISLNPSVMNTGRLAGQSPTNSNFQQLASGSKINRSADDAAGFALAERLTAQLGGFDAALRNANDAVSEIQVADGALTSLSKNLERIQSLTLQAGNGALNSQDRQALQSEVDQLLVDSGRILEGTNFNGKALLNNTQGLSVQLDAPGKTIQLEGENLAGAFQQSGFNNIDITSPAKASSALETINKVSEQVLSRQAELGAVSNRIESSVDTMQLSKVNTAEARSRISDADFAKVASELAVNQFRDQAQIAVQVQANGQRDAVLKLLS